MGHQLHSSTTNGTNGSSSNGSASGPSKSGNGQASSSKLDVSGIRQIQLEGVSMYEDDDDWAKYQARPEYDGNGHDINEPETVNSVIDGQIVKRVVKGPAAAKRMPVNREEAVRLMLQGLRDIGYHQSADVLEAESGIELHRGVASDFQAAIFGGRWAEAVQLLPEMGIPSETPKSTAPSSSTSSVASGKSKAIVTGTGTKMEQAKFLIAQQKYLELLELGQQKKALNVLRLELAALTKDQEALHAISVHLMCLDKEELYRRALWDGAAGTSRRQLLEALQEFISPKIMVPSRRLATLFDQARRFQQQSCVYHDDTDPSSLYTDHECKNGSFPTVTTHVLADHGEEVWHIEWSPDGMMLASSGKEPMVVLWKLEVKTKKDGTSAYKVHPSHHLKGHRDPVDTMAWAPDGKMLVTAASNRLHLWDVETGALIALPPGSPAHSDTISAVRWKPDGSEFLVSSLDCKLVFYDARGAIKRQWSLNTMQIYDFRFTADSQSIIAGTTSLKRVAVQNKLKQSVTALVATAGSPLPRDFNYGAMEHNIVSISLENKEVTDLTQDLKSTISSVSMSQDGKRVLVSTGSEIQMWGLEPTLHYIRSFTGFVHTKWLIGSCFGGTNDRFVISGSENGHVYAWHTNNGQSLAVLQGHHRSVNSVAWNPVASRRIFASCSDDQDIRIWQPAAVMADADADAEITDDKDADVVLAEDDSAPMVEEEEGMVL